MSNSNQYHIVLGSLRYKTAIDTDLTLNIPFVGQEKELNEYDRNNVVSLAQVFDDERQASSIFRPTADITYVFYNAYSGTTGINGNDYKPFTNNLYYLNTINSFGTSLWSGFPQYTEFDLVRTDNNTPGYTTGGGSTPPHMYFINKLYAKYNWMFYLSYAYENDYTKTLEYYSGTSKIISWSCGDGIPFVIQRPYNPDGQDLISFICPAKHGLSVGEFVELNIAGWNGFNGKKVFEVYSLGQEGAGSDEYIFNLYNYGFGSSLTNQSRGTFKRIIDLVNSAETKSIYYVRKNKILTKVDDAIVTKAGFEMNGFDKRRQYEYPTLTPDGVGRVTTKEANNSFLLSFSRDVDISTLVDNLKRPITELYFTIINKGYFGWFNPPLDNTVQYYPSLRVGYDFNLSTQISSYWRLTNRAINKSNIPTDSYVRTLDGKSYKFYFNQDLSQGDVIDGDFCEFNYSEQKERVISNCYHKFVFNNLLFNVNKSPLQSVNPQGYYYQPYTPITLRVYSDYIEEGNVNTTEGIPNYAYYSKYRNAMIWRDLYTYGYVDSTGLGVDYPFLNGAHYPSTKLIFKVMPEGYTHESITNIADPLIDPCE
jgi:hypothetical protein